MKKQLFSSAALIAFAIPSAAFAQSTGTIAAEEETIVVTGTRTRSIQGVEIPNTPKAQTVLTNEYLQRQAPGQSVLNAINVVPSVNFTDNDPYGSSGGNVRIRGFDGNRISLTFDGIPLNDTGNYAIFSNQQLDQEFISSVNVNQGTTDVDSPTAASSGGTINYRSITPSEEMGAIVKASYGDFDYFRVIGVINSGEFTSFGTRMAASISGARNDKFKGPGKLDKEQYNIKFYQPLAGTDFIALSGHFNQNRNNFIRNLTIAQARQDFADNGRFDYDNNPRCVRPTPTFGTAQNEAATLQPIQTIPAPVGVAETSCTNYFNVRINPSDTGNVRANMKFSLTDKLTFTADPSFQYTLANGGGFTTLAENSALARGTRLQTAPAAQGIDLNGDGDALDTVAFYSPNTTNTYRYGLLASLRYDINDSHYVRIAYAYDRGEHRQTGEWTFLDPAGNPFNVFGGRTGNGPKVFNADGYAFRQRDRDSVALLNQVSGEYRGQFLEDRLEVQLGLRAPFFKRELNQFCFTQVSNGNAVCTSQTLGTTPAAGTTYIVPNTFVPGATIVGTPVFAPFRQTYKYDKLLPNVGFTFRPGDEFTVFASFAKGLSAPRTDQLYRSPFVPVQPETTNNFDVGVRYTASRVQASLGGFYNEFKNRIVTSFDQDQGISIDRNVGRVEIKGVEASLDVRPFDWFTFRGFASYIDAKYKDNTPGTTAGSIFATAGKRLVETPEWQYGYRAEVNFEPVTVGVNFKKITSRFATDINDLEVPGYATFNADARVSLAGVGLERTFFQLNVVNLFNEKYLGSITTQINQAGNPNFQVGAPRAVSGTIQIGF